MSNYIVTGGLGVIGSRFVDVVVKNGHRALVIDAAEEDRNHFTADVLKHKHGDAVTIIKQRIEKTDLGPILKDADYMLHAAAHTGIPHSSQDPDDDWVSNVDATRHILEAMRKGNFKIPTVMLSSVKPYRVHDIASIRSLKRMAIRDLDFVNGIDETCLLEPDEPYAASKMAQSALAMAYGRTYGLPVTCLRCSNLYGDAPCHGPRHGWLTWFSISAALGWPIEVQGTGHQTRDMLFSDDVASATLAAIENIKELQGNVYNIGGGLDYSTSILESIDLISRITGKTIDYRMGPGRKNEDMIFITDYRKFYFATQWKPQVSVYGGVTRIIKWAENNRAAIHKMYAQFI